MKFTKCALLLVSNCLAYFQFSIPSDMIAIFSMYSLCEVCSYTLPFSLIRVTKRSPILLLGLQILILFYPLSSMRCWLRCFPFIPNQSIGLCFVFLVITHSKVTFCYSSFLMLVCLHIRLDGAGRGHMIEKNTSSMRTHAQHRYIIYFPSIRPFSGLPAFTLMVPFQWIKRQIYYVWL